MSVYIPSTAIPSYSVVQKPLTPSLSSLPVEIQEEVESHLGSSARQALFEALITVTHHGEPIDSPILKLHLLLHKIPSKYQQALARSDVSLRTFALNQLKLWESRQLAQVVEEAKLFELLRLVDDPAVFGFLREKIQQALVLKQKLLHWVERSKTEEVQAIAANALTILVKSGVQFNGENLRGIRVAGADLSFGVFDSAQLQGVDLRNVHFHNSWLREANLSEAQMAGVQFGEWLSLQEESEVYSCVYSPDGKTFAFGLGNGEISVYATSNWEKIHTLQGHTEPVMSVVYSPNGQQIVSGNADNTVRLWDAQTGSLAYTLQGHTNSVVSVVYSPSGQQIASASSDKTVRLWDAHSGAAVHTLRGHTAYVMGVVYSPSGAQIASGSLDQTVRLWEVASGECLSVIQDFAETVYSVAWKATPEGSYLLAGSGDKLVRQWELIERVDGVHAHLRWMSPPDHKLMVEDTLVEGVAGLSEMNLTLLKQRGAAVLSDLA